MRFAIVTVDRYLGVFRAFVEAGWRPVKLFTVPTTSALDNQAETIAYAGRHNSAIQLSRIMPRDLAELGDRGCEALVVASYNWKISDWRPYLKYGVNFHCSPLPEGRGPYPPVRAILEQHKSWAVTCHQITPKFDDGAILDSEKFPLQSDECHESLDLKIQMAATRLAARVATGFVELWDQATPQSEGSFWRKLKLEDQVTDFRQPVELVMRHVRAFGACGSFAKAGDEWIVATRAVGWTEQHGHAPGTVVFASGPAIVIAATDGYIGILESQPAPFDLAAQLHEPEPNKQLVASLHHAA